MIKSLVKNFATGRGGWKPDMVVIHITATDDIARVLATFNNEQEAKSSNYLIARNGEVYQLVLEEDQAWANGDIVLPTNPLVRERGMYVNPNLYSISIELIGVDDITGEQYKECAKLVKDIATRWSIPLDRTHIVAHREIKVTKECPCKVSVDKIMQDAQQLLLAERSILEKLISLYRQIISKLLGK